MFSLPGIHLRGKRLYLDALDVYVAQNVSFVDAYLAVSMRARGLTEIYSWDADFDKVPGPVRIEPPDPADV